jgi:hypothetical protein
VIALEAQMMKIEMGLALVRDIGGLIKRAGSAGAASPGGDDGDDGYEAAMTPKESAYYYCGPR